MEVMETELVGSILYLLKREESLTISQLRERLARRAPPSEQENVERGTRHVLRYLVNEGVIRIGTSSRSHRPLGQIVRNPRLTVRIVEPSAFSLRELSSFRNKAPILESKSHRAGATRALLLGTTKTSTQGAKPPASRSHKKRSPKKTASGAATKAPTRGVKKKAASRLVKKAARKGDGSRSGGGRSGARHRKRSNGGSRGPRKTVSVERYPSITPSHLAQPGSILRLYLDLLQEDSDPQTEHTEAVKINDLPEDWKTLDIDVWCYSDDLQFVEKDSGSITIRRDADSVPCVLAPVVLETARKKAAIVVSAKFYYRDKFVGSATREVRTAHPDAGAAHRDSPTSGEHSEPRRRVKVYSQRTPGKRVLEVTISGPDRDSRNLHWRLALKGPFDRTGLPNSSTGRSEFPEKIEQDFRKIATHIQDKELGEHLRALHGFGGRLYKSTPEVFRNTYSACRNNHNTDFAIQLICDDLRIPWELMRPELGGRKLQKEPPDIISIDHPMARWPGKLWGTMPLPTGGIVTVIPKYGPSTDLPNVAGARIVAGVLQRDHGARACTPAGKDRVLEFFQYGLDEGKQPVAILLFAGHGQRGSESSLASIFLEDDELSDIELDVPETQLGNTDRTFVVFNACETAIAEQMLGDTSGFAAVLLGRNFSGFFAPFWAARDSSAEAIMRDFFELALRKKRLMLGEIAQSIHSKHGQSSATGLAYVCYGDVLAKFPK